MLRQTRILDLSVVIPGSYASLLLADLGAEVIKIERPPDGELTRKWEPKLAGEGHRFLQRNRNKESVVLDLKTDRGVDLFYKLVETADVIIEGFRPGVVDRLGIGYDDVRERNPDIVYCSLTGYGQDSPRADEPGHDVNYIGIGGLLGATRADGRPVIPGHPIADLSGGLFAAFSILAALVQRDEYGGQHIDTSLTDVVFSWNLAHAGEHFGTGGEYDPADSLTSGAYPCYHVYQAGDEKPLALGAVEAKFWERFCDIIGRPDLADDHLNDDTRTERLTAVKQVLATAPRNEWLDRFEKADIPCTPVYSLGDAIESDHAAERELLDEVEFDGERLRQLKMPFGFSEFDPSIRSAPPRLGEDTRDVLADLGIADDTIDRLAREGVVQTGPSHD